MSAGDTVLGMSLADGGHLTHGASVNFSGKVYNAVQYGIDADGHWTTTSSLISLRRISRN